MATGTVEGVVGALRRAGVSCEPVGLNQGETFLDDPLFRSLGLVTWYPHAEWGELEQVGAFWSLGDLEVRLDRAPPALGQHTIEVLVEAGMAPDAIERLLTSGVVVQAGAGAA
jgi:crotonobetainyl-CoA:carnitine CoA-transferase CaiB-like acyl-CoA transferase